MSFSLVVVVELNLRNTVLVFFFGEHNYALVPPESVVPFLKHLEGTSSRQRRSKSKTLRAAMREAEAIHNGELVIDESTLVADDPVEGEQDGKVWCWTGRVLLAVLLMQVVCGCSLAEDRSRGRASRSAQLRKRPFGVRDGFSSVG